MTTTFQPQLSAARRRTCRPTCSPRSSARSRPERAAGVDIISLGIGDPDTPTPAHIVARPASRASHDPRTHQYPTNRGTAEFREAVAAYYRHRFGVELDEQTEIVPLLGAKEGIAHIGFAAAGSRRRAASRPIPAIPCTPPGRCWPAARRCRCRCVPSSGFSPTWTPSTRRSLARRHDDLFVSYPNNPTGAVIEDDFFARLVAFAREHDIVVVHDNAYADITFDGYVAPSFLRDARGAEEVGVELFSLSKSYNMTGWRAGAIVGNPDVVDAFWRLKTNMDSGMFGALQHAAGSRASPARRTGSRALRLYARRRDLLVARAAPRRAAASSRRRARSTCGRRCRRPHLRQLRRARARPGGRDRLAGGRLRARPARATCASRSRCPTSAWTRRWRASRSVSACDGGRRRFTRGRLAVAAPVP